MTYGHFKDLPRRTASAKALRDKAYNIAKYLKYDGYQRGLEWFTDFLIKDLLVVVLHTQINLLLNTYQINNYLNSYTNQLLKKFKNEKYTHLLKIISEVLI